MTPRTPNRWSLALMLSAFVSGCGTYRMSEIQDLPPSEAAVLNMSFPRLWPEIFVTHIDCESPGFTSPKSFQLAPGWRAITLQGNEDLFMASDPKTYILRFEAGRSYTYYKDPNNDTNTWLLVFGDDADDARVDALWVPAGLNLLNGAVPTPESCELAAELNRTGAVDLPGRPSR